MTLIAGAWYIGSAGDAIVFADPFSHQQTIRPVSHANSAPLGSTATSGCVRDYVGSRCAASRGDDAVLLSREHWTHRECSGSE
ncbi:hypothetical protein RSSM_00861 [Rhodopirellula sallentina SM41]|uniref:Uncharacterized protein n=1 Tax=Rhodopirellula sallentina SM41 TaxID=1263870 RepID=M5U899_9BACT|nr:hypothetical protein RSSM_00861 [Rhodopirellula sallentina SM41]